MQFMFIPILLLFLGLFGYRSKSLQQFFCLDLNPNNFLNNVEYKELEKTKILQNNFYVLI
jgi:hypothetical protein